MSIAQHNPSTVAKEQRRRLRYDSNVVGLLMLVLAFSTQVAYPLVETVLFLVGAVPAGGIRALDNTAYLCVYAGVYCLAMGAPLLLLPVCRRAANPFAHAKRVGAGVGFFGVLAAVGVCMLANVINSYVLYFLSEHGIAVPETPSLMVATPTSLVLNLVVLAVLPAVLEEWVFRAGVLRLLRPYGPWFALVASSLLFGLMHGNLRQIPFATIVGLVLGWLYVITENIWLPMVVHFANNAISVVVEYATFSLTDEAGGRLYTSVLFRLIALGLLALVLLLSLCRDQLRARRARSKMGRGQLVAGLLTAPAFWLGVAVLLALTWLGM